jgi:hypothetical protein
MEEQLYTKDFYEWQQEGSRQSARVTIPLILDLIQPKSVIDVGCGVGTWLSVFKEFGIQDCLGIDGDYVDQKMLQIPQSEFLSFDLKKPLLIDRKFDLVVSLEVAEHLPSNYSDAFIASLTNLGQVILFSAAIPLQGGSGHVNEQWPEYWAQIFDKYGYTTIDCLRNKIWNNENVEPWYAQNLLIFVDKSCLSRYPSLQEEMIKTDTSQLSKVHPKTYVGVVSWYQNKLQDTVATVLSYTLKLRNINVIIFPDWIQPEDVIFQDLASVIKVIMEHPDKNNITLLIDTNGIDNDDANLVLSGITMELFIEDNLDVTDGPEISLTGELNQIQWQALMPSIYARIILDNENKQAIYQAGAENIPSYSIASLSNLQFVEQ